MFSTSKSHVVLPWRPKYLSDNYSRRASRQRTSDSGGRTCPTAEPGTSTWRARVCKTRDRKYTSLPRGENHMLINLTRNHKTTCLLCLYKSTCIPRGENHVFFPLTWRGSWGRRPTWSSECRSERAGCCFRSRPKFRSAPRSTLCGIGSERR